MQEYIRKNFDKKLISFLCIVIGILFLTPRSYEIGGETWKVWYAAKILRITGEFANLSMGPLYSLYLQIFHYFNYALATKLEFFITHTFASWSMYLLVRKYFTLKLALIITLCWIPMLAYLVTTKYVFASIFLAFYYQSKRQNERLIPASLVLGTASSPSLGLFLVGHIIGFLFKKIKNGTLSTLWNIKSTSKVNGIISGCGILLIVTALTMTSQRDDNNPHMTSIKGLTKEEKNSHFTTAFFQLGLESHNYNYNTKKTRKEVYGDSKTVFEAVKYNPTVTLNNILYNLRNSKYALGYFTYGNFGIKNFTLKIFPIFLLVNVVYLITLFQFCKEKCNKEEYSILFSSLLGSSALIIVFLLTMIKTRYVLQLWPVGLLIFCHTPIALGAIIRSLKTFPQYRFARIIGILIFISSLIFITIIIQRENNPPLTIVNKLFLLTIPLAIFAYLIFIYLHKGYRNKINLHFTFNKFNFCYIVFCSVLTFTNSYLGISFRDHIDSILRNDPLLTYRNLKDTSQDLVVSHNTAYKEIFSLLNSESRVLAWDETWVQAFSNVPLNNVFGPNSNQYLSDNPLKDINTVLLSHTIKPQLILDRLKKENWTKIPIKYYGDVYLAPKKN